MEKWIENNEFMFDASFMFPVQKFYRCPSVDFVAVYYPLKLKLGYEGTYF